MPVKLLVEDRYAFYEFFSCEGAVTVRASSYWLPKRREMMLFVITDLAGLNYYRWGLECR